MNRKPGNQEDWLTEKQIKSYFSNAKAEKIFETKEPTQEEIDEGRQTRIQTARAQLVDYIHKRLGITEFGGPRATKSRMAGIVVKYVEDHCDCLMV